MFHRVALEDRNQNGGQDGLKQKGKKYEQQIQ